MTDTTHPPTIRDSRGHTFRATVKTYIRRDAEGRVRPWTRDVRSGYRQTAHKRPQPPTEGRWSWVKEDDAS